MKAFGDQLQQARLAKGVTVRDVAASTRIGERYLHALERNNLEALPGSVFAKGYIRACAEFLDVDPTPLLEAYEVEERKRRGATPEDERRKLEELARLVESRSGTSHAGAPVESKRVVIAAVGSTLVVMLVVAAWLLSYRPNPDIVDEPSSTTPGLESRSLLSASTDADAPPAASLPKSGPALPLRVTQSGVGTDIVERSLVGRNDRFAEREKVWFWTRVVGGKRGESVRHVWLHRNRTYMIAELTVGAAHWRTYSTFVLEPGSAGEWAVEVHAADGRVLAREEFTCLTRS